MCERLDPTRRTRLHNRRVARSAHASRRLVIGTDVAAVLRPEEEARLHDVRDIDRVRCRVCGGWIEPGSSEPTSVSMTIEGDLVAADFSHAECSSSCADLASLAVLANAEPLGIEYAQALHPEAGAVLIWERKLDLRLRGVDGGDACLYLDPDWWDGFHPARDDGPVRLLAGWLLRSAGDDLVLRHGEQEVERFHDAVASSPDGWLESVRESGFCLLIVGSGMGLGRPRAAGVQQAIREHRALLGLAECDV
jgi:hypothetical protein